MAARAGALIQWIAVAIDEMIASMSPRKHVSFYRVTPLALCLVLTALLGACSQNKETDAQASRPSAAAKMWIGEFQSGTRLGPHGGIAHRSEKTVFSAGDMIHIAMKLRDAPPGTTVTVVWKAPSGQKLGEETKRLRPGQDYMYFSADGENLQAGSGYHAEISTNGKPVTVVSFDFT